MRMNHSAAKDLNPSLSFAETAALTATLEAGYIHLGTRLRELEMMRTELNLCVFTKQSLCKLLKRSLQIREGDVLIDNKSLDPHDRTGKSVPFR